jgi:urea transport system substrate-binding protein
MNDSSSPSEQREQTPDVGGTIDCPWPFVDGALAGQTQAETPAVSSATGENGEGSKRFAFLTPAQSPQELGWLGAYRIRGVLGEGGMGVVFDAEDSQLRRRVALKILKPELAPTPSLRERFLQEARAVAALPSDHVVAIYHVGSEGEVPYLAMQYLHGEALEECLQREGRLPAAEAARIGSEIALGLAAAHEAGLIHRDIKPGNIWLETLAEPRPLGSGTVAAPTRVKLLDFGLARVAGGVSTLTASGAIVGTPHYLAPEQARGQTLDHRCDLFALGCVLYRSLTGVMPFDGPDLLGLLSSLAVDEPRPIRDFAPDTPAELVDLIRQLLSKSPSQRPATAREVAERLRVFERPTSAPALRSPPAHSLPAFRLPSSGRFVTGLLLGGVLASLIAILTVWGWLKMSKRSLDPALDCSLQGHPIPVGVLQARSGSLVSLSAALAESTELAIDEINQQGGVLGSRIEPIRVDVSPDESAFAQESERLIVENHVCALFGCCSAAGRKRIVPLVEKYNHLLFYPVQNEGLEQSPNVVYLGATLNQQILPGVQFAIGTLRKRRLFFVGSDYLYARTAHAVLRDALAQVNEASVVGEQWIPLEGGDMKETAARIVASKADLIVNTLNGDSNAPFFRALRAAGVTAEKTPTLSFGLGENELRALPIRQMSGDYAAWSYFQSVHRPENTAFVHKFQARYGAHRTVSDAMESAYGSRQ